MDGDLSNRPVTSIGGAMDLVHGAAGPGHDRPHHQVSAVDLRAQAHGPVGAPTVLLLGSLGSTAAMWDRQVPALAERFRVVRADTRGHGRSPVPPGPYALDDLVDDAVALLDRLDVARAHLVGLSLGGMTALRLAAREPQRVGRVVVLCTSAHLPPSQAWHARAALVREQGTAAVAAGVVQRWFTAAYRAADRDRTAEAERAVSATPSEGYAGCCEAVAGMDLRADLPAVAAPVLAVAGAQDPATPPEHLAAIASSVPAGRLVVVEQAAHMAAVEQPARVNAALLEHLTRDTS